MDHPEPSSDLGTSRSLLFSGIFFSVLVNSEPQGSKVDPLLFFVFSFLELAFLVLLDCGPRFADYFELGYY